MKERPILFSGPMVHALLAGTKTQTRRLVRLPPSSRLVARIVPSDGGLDLWDAEGDDGLGLVWHSIECPHGRPGHRLWVRETWAEREHSVNGVPMDSSTVYYKATDERVATRWRPSIFMPRRASRIALEVTEVRVQRLQEISAEDAKAEGVLLTVRKVSETHGAPLLCISASPYPSEFKPGTRPEDWTPGDYWRHAYAILWDSINGKRARWTSNPWVWAITFRRQA